MRNIILISTIVSVFFARAQKYTIKESPNVTTTLTLYVNNEETNKTSYESNFGFIRNTSFRKRSKQTIDTIYFKKNLNENPENPLESKLSRIKTNNRYQHYIVYDTDPWKLYTLKKDSLLLEGSFKLIDTFKPRWESDFDFDFYERYGLEKPKRVRKRDRVDCFIPRTMSAPIGPEQNSEGSFSKGYKIGTWIFNQYQFATVEENYKKGIREGVYKVYDTDGSIIYETIFHKGTGEERMFRNDGSLYHIKYFKNGEEDYSKITTFYHRNGTVAVRNDYPNNKVKKYYDNGALRSIQEIVIKENKIYYDGAYEGYSKKEPGEIRERAYKKDNISTYQILYNYKEKIKEIRSGKMTQYFDTNEKVQIIYSEHMVQYFKKGKLIKTVQKTSN